MKLSLALAAVALAAMADAVTISYYQDNGCGSEVGVQQTVPSGTCSAVQPDATAYDAIVTGGSAIFYDSTDCSGSGTTVSLALERLLAEGWRGTADWGQFTDGECDTIDGFSSVLGQ